MKSRIYRCNCRKVWTVQNRKANVTASRILLNGKWMTELKPDRSCNPKGFVTTNNSQDIILNPEMDLVEDFILQEKLIYDKEKINFNFKSGEYLYFTENGTCYMLIKK